MQIEFIKPNATILDRTHQGKVMEEAGRICWKSESNVTDTSYIKFVDSLVKRGHLSVTEHAITYTQVTADDLSYLLELKSTGIYHGINFMNFVEIKNSSQWYLAFNFRSGFELMSLVHQGDVDIKRIRRILHGTPFFPDSPQRNITEQQIINTSDGSCLHMIYASFKVISDRAIGNEFVRHRSPFSQESTRYVNYLKRPAQFCVPYHIQDAVEGFFELDELIALTNITNEEDQFKHSCAVSYQEYLNYQEFQPANIARGCLPLFLKTEYHATNTIQGWNNFAHYREDPAAHQDIRTIIAKTIGRQIKESYPELEVRPKQLHQYIPLTSLEMESMLRFAS